MFIVFGKVSHVDVFGLSCLPLKWNRIIQSFSQISSFYFMNYTSLKSSLIFTRPHKADRIVTLLYKIISFILENIALKFFWKTPFEKAFRRPPHVVLRNNSLVHDYWVFISHFLPAYMIDLMIRVSGKRP